MASDYPASFDRVPPQNLEAEQAVLGSMLIERPAVERGSELLRPEDFYRDAHRHIFEGMLALTQRDEPVDLITLTDELRSRGQYDSVGGLIYLQNLMEAPSTAANIEYYARLVEEKSILRRLLDAGTQVQGLAYSEFNNISEVVDRAEQIVFEIGRRRAGQFFKPLRPLLDKELDRLDSLDANRGAPTGRKTPFDDLNYKTAGFQPSDLIIVAARPSMGKCVKWDTLIVDPRTGERRTIDECVRIKLPEVWGVSMSGTVRRTAVADWIDSGKKPCFRVTTDTGRNVEVTGHHPFLTQEGWKPLHCLEAGDKIGVPRTLPSFSPEIPRQRHQYSPGITRPSAIIWHEGLSRLTASLRSLLGSGRSIRCPDGSVSIEFEETRAEAATDILHGLTRLGIVAKVTRESRGRCLVDINEPRSVTEFIRQIGQPSETGSLTWLGADESLCPSEKHQETEGSDIYWDEITAIEPTGIHQVYDLTVPDGANFIAQDVCVHNTALSVQVAQYVALNEKLPVAIFSLEMSAEQLVTRMICSESKVDAHKLRTGFLQSDDWQRVGEGIQRLAEAPIFIDDSPDISVLEIRAKCRRLKAEQKGLGMVVIDYLQLMRSHKRTENRNQEISEITRSTKQMARELEVPVIALSQLSRAVESRPDKRPMLSDLRESGAIEAEADIVMFIYREAYYKMKEATSAEDDREQQGRDWQDRDREKLEVAELIIAKQRNGPTGPVKVGFLPHYARFENLAPGYYDDGDRE